MLLYTLTFFCCTVLPFLHAQTTESILKVNMTDECAVCADGEWMKDEAILLSTGHHGNTFCHICQQRERWSRLANDALDGRAESDPHWTPRQRAYMTSLQNCKGRQCLNQIPGAHGHGRVLRKEYRAMSDYERHQFHNAINQMKRDMLDTFSKYDLFVKVHHPYYAPEAHIGPAFLPFHREYLKQMELALRQINPNISLPYWDPTLDEGLPNPADSILWTPDFLGTARGQVVEGPFANWPALIPYGYEGGYYLERQVNTGLGVLYNPGTINYFQLYYTSFAQFDICIDPYFETSHGGVHQYIAGHMLETAVAPNDPVFFIFHSYIDYIWEKWRHTHQDSFRRENEYSPFDRECHAHPSVQAHGPHEQMKPFAQHRNIDGLSESYTRELYTYQDSPICNHPRTGCQPESPYLFCHRGYGRCLAKIRRNGDCRGLEHEDSCLFSRCIGGRCV